MYRIDYKTHNQWRMFQEYGPKPPEDGGISATFTEAKKDYNFLVWNRESVKWRLVWVSESTLLTNA